MFEISPESARSFLRGEATSLVVLLVVFLALGLVIRTPRNRHILIGALAVVNVTILAAFVINLGFHEPGVILGFHTPGIAESLIVSQPLSSLFGFMLGLLLRKFVFRHHSV